MGGHFRAQRRRDLWRELDYRLHSHWYLKYAVLAGYLGIASAGIWMATLLGI